MNSDLVSLGLAILVILFAFAALALLIPQPGFG